VRDCCSTSPRRVPVTILLYFPTRRATRSPSWCVTWRGLFRLLNEHNRVPSAVIPRGQKHLVEVRVELPRRDLAGDNTPFVPSHSPSRCKTQLSHDDGDPAVLMNWSMCCATTCELRSNCHRWIVFSGTSFGMQAVDPLHDPPCPLNARFNHSVGD
jgi:hypothetical protein